MSAIPPSTRAVVRQRSGGWCERCLVVHYTDIHHLQRREVGGHDPTNCVGLCRQCHNWVHAHPAQARERGWIVSAYQDAG